MKKFEELSLPNQKRRIVKDAIKQINSKIIKVSTGTYMDIIKNDPVIKSLQQLLEKGEKNTCKACAKGSLFAACVLNVNEVNVNNRKLDDESFQRKKLKRWFSILELDMIETAFEKRVCTDTTKKLETSYDCPTELGEQCIKFGRQYGKASERLISILENVLANKIFKP